MYLFIHIAKAAGTTFSHILKKNFKDKYVRIYGMKKIDFFNDEEVKALAIFFPEAECISAHKFVCPIPQPDNSNTNKIIDYKLITFLRNPVARAYSHYTFNRKRMEMGIIKKEFIEHPFDVYFNKLNEKGRQESNGRWAYLANMQAYIMDRNYDMQIAKNRMKNEFFFVGTTERFEQSLVILRNKFKKQGIDFKINYFKKNISNKKKKELDPKIKEMILEENMLDKELHDYVNQLLDEEIRNYEGDFDKDYNAFMKKQKLLSYVAWLDNIFKKGSRYCLRKLNKLVY